MNADDIQQVLDQELTDTRWFNNDPRGDDEQDALYDRFTLLVTLLLKANCKSDFEDALKAIVDEMYGEDVKKIVNDIVESEYRTRVIHQKLGTRSRKQTIAFNSATLEALADLYFLLPHHAINYCVCLGQISSLTTLLYKYPAAAIDVFAFDTLAFQPELVPFFTQIFEEDPTRYSGLFTCLLSPQDICTTMYKNVLESCLAIDHEKTLLYLDSTKAIPSEHIDIISSRLIGTKSFHQVLSETPELCQPFILKLLNNSQ